MSYTCIFSKLYDCEDTRYPFLTDDIANNRNLNDLASDAYNLKYSIYLSILVQIFSSIRYMNLLN